VTTQLFEDITLPLGGVIAIYVALLAEAIQLGSAVPPVSYTVVKAPVVAQELALQARIAGLEV
jgi:hypothetical protein